MPTSASNPDRLDPKTHAALLKEWADLRVQLVGTPLYAARVNEQHAHAYSQAVRNLGTASPDEIRDAVGLAVRATQRLLLLQAAEPDDFRRLMRMEEITFILARHRVSLAAA